MPAPSYPNFAGKHAGQAIFTAADFLAYLRQAGGLDDEVAPRGAVLCYQRSLYDRVLRAEGLKPPRRRDLPVPLPSTGGQVGLLGQFGIGAPAATAVVEQLAALGACAVVSIGTAGSLQRDLEPGGAGRPGRPVPGRGVGADDRSFGIKVRGRRDWLSGE